MLTQLELFYELKAEGVQWPEQVFPFGSSPCHWFNGPMRKVFSSILQQLPDHSIYLELGAFLGAGSTTVALNSNQTLRVVCADHFQVNPFAIPKNTPPTGMYVPGKRVLVDYMKGKGSCLEHCINNLWDHQGRVAIFDRQIDSDWLHELADRGLDPAVVMVDDEHSRDAVADRLNVISDRWPNALVFVDDYVPYWDGVIEGVQEAFRQGMYSRHNSALISKRLMLLRK